MADFEWHMAPPIVQLGVATWVSSQLHAATEFFFFWRRWNPYFKRYGSLSPRDHTSSNRSRFKIAFRPAWDSKKFFNIQYCLMIWWSVLGWLVGVLHLRAISLGEGDGAGVTNFPFGQRDVLKKLNRLESERWWRQNMWAKDLSSNVCELRALCHQVVGRFFVFITISAKGVDFIFSARMN